MIRMKGSRFVSLFLILAMAVCSLTGCSLFSMNSKGTMMAKIDTETIYKHAPSPLDDIVSAVETSSAPTDEKEDGGEDDLASLRRAQAEAIEEAFGGDLSQVPEELDALDRELFC